MPNRGPATIIIPAYNEVGRVGAVVRAAQEANPEWVRTDQIIVVDNNSTDGTADAATNLGALVIDCTEQGKGPALRTGVEVARSLGTDTITYLDADLVGLTGQHITELTRPVLEGRASMSIGYLGGRSDFLKSRIYQHWAMFSGQRTVPLEVWDKLSPRDLKSFRVEAALNSLFRRSGRGDEIARVELEGVTHTGKFDKYSTVKALAQYSRIELSAIYGLSSRSSL